MGLDTEIAEVEEALILLKMQKLKLGASRGGMKNLRVELPGAVLANLAPRPQPRARSRQNSPYLVPMPPPASGFGSIGN